jgi:hypothetical protein
MGPTSFSRTLTGNAAPRFPLLAFLRKVQLVRELRYMCISVLMLFLCATTLFSYLGSPTGRIAMNVFVSQQIEEIKPLDIALAVGLDVKESWSLVKSTLNTMIDKGLETHPDGCKCPCSAPLPATASAPSRPLTAQP